MHRFCMGLFSYFLLMTLMIGCASKPSLIRDVQIYSQDLNFYLTNSGNPETSFLTLDQTKGFDENFQSNFFSPWDKTSNSYSQEFLSSMIKGFRKNPGYGENKLPHDSSWLAEIESNIHIRDYPNTLRKAITIKNTSMRVLPTMKPHFNDFNAPGEGYPFDNLQNSAVWANTPVLISHTSANGEWVLAETSPVMGWIPADDIVYADEAFIQNWKTNSFVAILRDNTVIKDTNQIFRLNAYIGELLPVTGTNGGSFECLISVADMNRNAVAIKVMVSTNDAEFKPLPATLGNFTRVANQMVGQNYGWGGLFENRDCSAMIKDIMTPFGIWLPRNGRDMAKTYDFQVLTNLSPQEKKKILMNAVPFLSTVWLKGHIMLYIGNYNNEPLVLQNVWGLKIQEPFRDEGRFIIGKTVVTTLEPGIEIPFSSPAGTILQRAAILTVITNPPVAAYIPVDTNTNLLPSILPGTN